MDQSNIRIDHVSIEVGKLADSVRGKIASLKPLSENCCIYRVPPKIRMLNETLYTPKMVSIGPLHHGREELKAMQEYKLRYLQQFLDRTRVRMEGFLTGIKGREEDLRNYYAETINFGSEEFVEMVLLDAVFLIEIFLRCKGFLDEKPDRIFTNPRMIKDIVLDIMLLENQLPIFILEHLFTLADFNLDLTKYSLSQLVKYFMTKYICQDLLIDSSLIDLQAKHFVDLLRICLKPPRSATRRLPDSELVPGVTKLHQAGVKFELATTSNSELAATTANSELATTELATTANSELATTAKNLLDIRFEKGVLEIPKLPIGNMTEQLLRNLQIFEGLHSDTNYMNDYVVILNRLLNTPIDVEFLIHIGVIDNRILDSEGVSKLFQQLSKDARVDKEKFYYSDLVKDLQSYCKSPYHKSMAYLKQNYFNTPWGYIVVIGYVIIFVLTLIQTVCSIIQTVPSKKGQ